MPTICITWREEKWVAYWKESGSVIADNPSQALLICHVRFLFGGPDVLKLEIGRGE